MMNAAPYLIPVLGVAWVFMFILSVPARRSGPSQRQIRRYQRAERDRLSKQARQRVACARAERRKDGGIKD